MFTDDVAPATLCESLVRAESDLLAQLARQTTTTTATSDPIEELDLTSALGGRSEEIHEVLYQLDLKLRVPTLPAPPPSVIGGGGRSQTISVVHKHHHYYPNLFVWLEVNDTALAFSSHPRRRSLLASTRAAHFVVIRVPSARHITVDLVRFLRRTMTRRHWNVHVLSLLTCAQCVDVPRFFLLSASSPPHQQQQQQHHLQTEEDVQSFIEFAMLQRGSQEMQRLAGLVLAIRGDEEAQVQFAHWTAERRRAWQKTQPTSEATNTNAT